MIVFIIGIMVLGLFVLFKFKVNQNFDVEILIIVVSIFYLGVLFEMSECEIVNCVEWLLLVVLGVIEVCFIVGEGQVIFVLQFDFKKNLIEVVDDVCNVIVLVCYNLLQEMCEFILQCVDLLVQLVMQVLLELLMLIYVELLCIVEDQLVDKFCVILGVGKVEVFGLFNCELFVLL